MVTPDLSTPDFKRSEAGVIPRDWDVVSLGDVTDSSSGTTPSRSLYDRYYRDGSIPWVKTLDLNNCELHFTDECVTVTAISETSLRIYPVGSVLVAMYGGFGQIGRTGLLQIPAAVNQALTAVRPHRSRLNSHYLLHLLNHRVSYWRQVASSSRRDPNITGGDVRSFPVAVPALGEQEAIAAALNDASRLIESLEQLLAKKSNFRAGMMNRLLTEAQRLEGSAEKWLEKPLGELFKFTGGYSASRAQLSQVGHRYLHYGDIHGTTSSTVDVDDPAVEIPRLNVPLADVPVGSLLDDGDVVFVDASEDVEGASRHVVIGNKTNQPFISGLHTIVAKASSDDLISNYRRYCFDTRGIKEQFRFYAVGTKVTGVSKSNIARIMIPVPPKQEQDAIAAVLMDIDSELSALGVRLQKARRLKQGMAQDLLTGAIRLV